MTTREEFLSPLTKRERELVDLLVLGYTNARLAESMGITLNTVKTHLKNIYMKLRVKNRQQLIVMVLTSNSESPVHSKAWKDR